CYSIRFLLCIRHLFTKGSDTVISADIDDYTILRRKCVKKFSHFNPALSYPLFPAPITSLSCQYRPRIRSGSRSPQRHGGRARSLKQDCDPPHRPPPGRTCAIPLFLPPYILRSHHKSSCDRK